MLQWVKFYHEHVLNKEPGTEKPTPWHHDQSYYPINGDKVNYTLFTKVPNKQLWTADEGWSPRLGVR